MRQPIIYIYIETIKIICIRIRRFHRCYFNRITTNWTVSSEQGVIWCYYISSQNCIPLIDIFWYKPLISAPTWLYMLMIRKVEIICSILIKRSSKPIMRFQVKYFILHPERPYHVMQILSWFLWKHREWMKCNANYQWWICVAFLVSQENETEWRIAFAFLCIFFQGKRFFLKRIFYLFLFYCHTAFFVVLTKLLIFFKCRF